MRAPGHPQGCFVTEVVMDDLAAKIGIDPLELRLKNLPPEAPDAQWGKYLRMGAEKFGWNKRHADGDPTSGPLKRGIGCAANRWGGGGRGTKAHAEILSDGSVTIRTGTQDIGTGTRTLIAIVAAETLGIPVNTIKVEIGDSNFPFSGGSGGSTTAASVMPAIRIVTGKAFDALAARIAPSLGVAADQLVARDGRITVKTDASKRLTWKEACKRLGAEPVVADGEWEAGLSASGTSGVQFAEVEVDVETGVATRHANAVRAGRRLDPRPAHGGEPVHGRHHRWHRLRALRAPDSRSQHGVHGQPEHGVVLRRRPLGYPADRDRAGRSARARRHRPRRAADGFDRGRRRQRRFAMPSARAFEICRSRQKRCWRPSQARREGRCEALRLRRREERERGRRRARGRRRHGPRRWPGSAGADERPHPGAAAARERQDARSHDSSRGRRGLPYRIGRAARGSGIA